MPPKLTGVSYLDVSPDDKPGVRFDRPLPVCDNMGGRRAFMKAYWRFIDPGVSEFDGLVEVSTESACHKCRLKGLGAVSLVYFENLADRYAWQQFCESSSFMPCVRPLTITVQDWEPNTWPTYPWADFQPSPAVTAEQGGESPVYKAFRMKRGLPTDMVEAAKLHQAERRKAALAKKEAKMKSRQKPATIPATGIKTQSSRRPTTEPSRGAEIIAEIRKATEVLERKMAEYVEAVEIFERKKAVFERWEARERIEAGVKRKLTKLGDDQAAQEEESASKRQKQPVCVPAKMPPPMTGSFSQKLTAQAQPEPLMTPEEMARLPGFGTGSSVGRPI